MTPTEIIKADAKKHNIDPNRVLTGVAQIIEKKQGSFVSAGDTILLIKQIPEAPGCAEIHMFTADTPKGLMKNIPYLIDTIKKTKLLRVYVQTDNEGIVEMLRRLGVEVSDSDLPQYNWMAEVK